MAANLKSHIQSSFKMNGLTLRSEASRYLVDVMAPVNESQRDLWMDKIIEIIQKQPLSSAMIDRNICTMAVQECNDEQEEEGDKIFCIIDAFSVPRFAYHADRKKFIPEKDSGMSAPVLHGSSSDKVKLFLDRYAILHQRTLRHDLFTAPILGSMPEEGCKKFQLKPLEYLLGSTTRIRDIIVLGMLTQIKEGKWYIEDPTGAVPIDLTNANFHTGLFTENSFVLAEGVYEDGMFEVSAFGFPPPESSQATRSYFGNLNFFGGPSNMSVKASARLRQVEQENQDAIMVFLSDVWLDNIKVMEKLRELFTGFSDFPPTCFVFCGNFSSVPHGTKHVKLLKESFHNLAELICEFPTIKENSRFVFVPGPLDPGPSTILPRPAIPNSITEEIRQRVPQCTFTSNPCRLQYCTQQIVVFREDIVTKMCRNCVKFPADGDIPTHFAKSLISQGHLCPLPLHVCPVYWAYDRGMSLYPLPDLVVCADKFDPFHTSLVDCTVMNPGSFPKTGYSFKVYMPATREIQDSKIED